MAKLTLNDIQNLENSETAKNTINNNSAATETALEKTLSRDGTNPNQMLADLDMNSNRILNLPAPVDPTEPVRKKEADDFVGFKETMQLTAAVGAAQAAAVTATDQSALAKKWATNPLDVPVTTPPDEFSARHWAIKAQQAIVNVISPREYLTADKIWYVALKDNAFPGSTGGNDTTGDGTFAKPWHSVNRAMKHILSNVDCNGHAPVIQMFPGHYDANYNDINSSYRDGMTPPGFVTWGAFDDVSTEGNTYDYGGAIVEMNEPLIGKQGTGGQPIRLCSLDNAHGPDTIITTHGQTPISVLQSGRLILSSLSFQVIPDFTIHTYRFPPADLSTRVINYPSTIYATQGGVVELGSGIINLGAAGHFLHADTGGIIVLTGDITLRSGTSAPAPSFASFAYAGGAGSFVGLLGSIDLQGSGTHDAEGVDTAPYGGPHHFQQAFCTATQGGKVAFSSAIEQPPPAKQIANPTLYPTKQLSSVTPKYLANLAGSIAGVTALNAIPGGSPGSISSATFAYGI